MADIEKLEKLARLVRFYILEMTTRVGSGHTNSSLSAVELAVSLFSTKFRFDLKNPENPANDRIIFSKGHASPLVYALYAAYSGLTEKDLTGYRTINSPLEGHPNPRFKYADVATGSLGQGLGIGLGMALALRLAPLTQGKLSDYQLRTTNYELPTVYVLMGDGEFAEGSVWEAMEVASHYKADNLIGIVDVNRLGQSGETLLGWDVETYKKRVEAFGWQAMVIDGHDLKALVDLWTSLETGKGKPVIVIAKTVKGKGVSMLEDVNGWHGRPLPQEDFEKAVKELGNVDKSLRGKVALPDKNMKFSTRSNSIYSSSLSASLKVNFVEKVPYKINEEIATRKAYGEALTVLAEVNPLVVSLDADVKNSTYTESFNDKYPKRFYEMFIAEQNMVSVAVGMAAMGYVPFVATFGVFLTRAFDQIRMAGYSRANVKFLGSHAGVSIGEDGPSQMALQDIAMFRTIDGSTILYPADGVATWRMVQLASKNEGIFYIRTNRPATPVIYTYKEAEQFKIGGSKVVRSSSTDKLTIVACGVTLIEALRAADELKKKKVNVRVIDAYSVKPIDEKTLRKAASETNNLVITVEDHYPEGGLGDAVLNVFAQDGQVKVFKLAVAKMPKSGKPQELLDYEGISSRGIIDKILQILG
ncbi:transketolase [Candidatus Curtissbacteria bacterium RIFCSPHIGHO2_02_FULL_40_17]|uniref:Transketolase n=1 Tax=Candidatus Curtissbacteria bacterium RIFCSPHIGHO2_02_FULL_40_17 TaxID=1797715 RepID=A0A1F5GG70_9BACT|nr:MAG: transketolase [Candidatus Curtissbacteria bacterium RIFCSPHIGHO2_02_FULL_40_17]